MWQLSQHPMAWKICEKKKMNNGKDPNKNTISIAERERQVPDSVPRCHKKSSEKFIDDYCSIFSEKIPNGAKLCREVQHQIEVEQCNETPLPATIPVRFYWTGWTRGTDQGYPGSSFHLPVLESVRGTILCCAQERWQMLDAYLLQGIE